MKYVLKQILHILVLLLGVLVLNFCLIHLAPGDPADVLAGEMGGATEQIMTEIRAAYGLDQPFAVQLFNYLGRVTTFDFGKSFYFNQPVTDLILSRLLPTVWLVVVSLFLAIIVGTWLGIVSAQKPNGWLSHLITVFSLFGYATPVFWLGIMLVILFASVLPLFPVSGMVDASVRSGNITFLLNVLWHSVLPIITLATIYLAFYSRLARTSMLDVLGADYVRTAKAKGLSRRLVIYKHALRNAVLPIITYAGLQFGQVISGAVLVETVFAWPGLGTLAYESILRRDSPVLLGILFFSALLVVFVNLLTDLAYRIVDPRIGAS